MWIPASPKARLAKASRVFRMFQSEIPPLREGLSRRIHKVLRSKLTSARDLQACEQTRIYVGNTGTPPELRLFF